VAATCALICAANLAIAGTAAATAARPTVYTFGVPGTSGKVPVLQHERPTPIEGIKGTVIQIATSNSDTYALTSAGTVWAWGVGSLGELGNGSHVAVSTSAARVEFPVGVRITSLGNPMPYDGALAIDSHGDAWGWGVNSSSDLCIASSGPVLWPTKVPLPDVTLAAGAGTHALFDSSGSVYGCGKGDDGQLGDGTTANSPTPIAVLGLPKGRIRLVTASWKGSGALMASGVYYDWGLNAAGQLGDGSTTNSDMPVRVDLPRPAVDVFQGGSQLHNGQTLAILKDGSLWTWGDGQWGQLGDGVTANALTPTRVKLPNGARPTTVSSGGFASYAIDRSGRLWAWGRDEYGQLGTGTIGETRSTPISVGRPFAQVSSTATNVAALAR
jgi:alpha-tubulin suppressor-like RCC1 family protein